MTREIPMDEQVELNADERQWLFAIARGPLTRLAVNRSMPESIRESLIGKRLMRWKIGFLEATPRGIAEAMRLRARG